MKRFAPVLVVAVTVCAVLLGNGAAALADGQLPPAPDNLPQSWIAYFHLSTHIVRVGETLTGTITIPPIGDCGKGHRCVSGVSIWGGLGLRQLGKCDLQHRHCRFKAIDETDTWQSVDMNISNDVGPAVSKDYYLVVDPNTYVLDGTITSKTNPTGVPGVQLRISGKQRATATTNGNGYYAVRLKKGRYAVTPSKAGEKGHFAPRTAHVNVRRHGRNTQNFRLRQSFPSNLIGVTKNGGQVASGERIGGAGDQVSFIGSVWDPEGDAIQVTWNGTQIGSYTTPASFSGSWQLPVFPTDSCRGTLRAVQGEFVKSLALHADPAGQIAFADGDVHAGFFRGDHVDAANPTRTLKPKSVLCEGEGAYVGPTGAAIWANTDAFEISDKPKGIHVWGAVSTPSGTLALSGGRTVQFAIGGPDPHTFDPALRGAPNVVRLGPTLSSGSGTVNLGGFYSRDGDLSVPSALHLDGAVLYVNGNATLSAGLNGVGAVIVTGNLTIKGPIELRTDSTNALVVGGALSLGGS